MVGRRAALSCPVKNEVVRRDSRARSVAVATVAVVVVVVFVFAPRSSGALEIMSVESGMPLGMAKVALGYAT